MSYKSLESGIKQFRELKEEFASAGRDAGQVRIMQLIYAVVAPTREQARDKLALIESLSMPADGLVLLSEIMNFDFGSKPYTEPLSDQEMAQITGMQAMRDRVVQQSGKANPSAEDFVKFTQRGTPHDQPLFCGTPEDIADEMQAWYGQACDGFVIAATHVPGSYEDFARMVVPELQRRGLFHTEYEGTTLRDSLGLDLP